MKRFSQTRGALTRYGIPLLAVGMLFFAISSSMKDSGDAVADPQVPPPSRMFAQQVAGIGITEPKSELVSVGSHLPGIVSDVRVKTGDGVKAGDVLFTLDNRDAQAQLTVAQARVATTEAEAKDARHQFTLYNSVSDKRAVSEDELSRRRFAAAAAEARAKEAKAQAEQARVTLSRLKVQAPIAGTVLRVNVRPGEFAPAGETREGLVLLGDVATMHVRVEIDESDALKVTPSAKAFARVRGYPDKNAELSFVRKEMYVRPKRSLTGSGTERVDTRVQEIIYAFDNSALGTFAGQQMDVFIETEAK